MRQITQTRVRVFDTELRIQSTHGSGTTIVFEAGAGQWSDHWLPVIHRLPGSFHALAYDRAGLGQSPRTKRCRGILQMAEELVALLDALSIRKPIVFVGHSFGASVIRCFAELNPGRCAGVIFLDGWHASFSDWEKQSQPSVNAWAEKLFFLIARLGGLAMVNRLFPQPKPAWKVSEEQWRNMQRSASQPAFFKTMQREMAQHEQGDQWLNKIQTLDAPVLAIVCKQTLSADDVPKDYPLKEHNSAWFHSSSKLAKLSSQNRTVVEKQSGHMLILESPERVVHSIVEFVESIS